MRSVLSSSMRWFASGCATLGLCAATATAQVQLAPVRAVSRRLHESMRREAFAAIDRGRDFLAASQLPSGRWPAANGAETCVPALAFAGDTLAERDAAVLRRAVAAAAEALERSLARLLAPADCVEMTWGAGLLFLAGGHEPLVARALRRLRALDPGPFPAATTALLAELQDARATTDSRTAWNAVLAKTLRSEPPTPGTVALAALARIRREKTAPSEPALQAHLRWLGRHWPASAPEMGQLARLLEETPHATLHAADFPLDWRQRLADALIARQRRDPRTGFGYWSDPAAPFPAGNAAVLAETTAAVVTLRLLAP